MTAIGPGVHGRASMPFRYQALDSNGAIVRGSLHAYDQMDAVAALAAQGLTPVQVQEERGGRIGARSRMPASELAVGLRIMATLLEAGLPLRRAASTFELLAPPHWAPVVDALRPALRDGRGLSAALEEARVQVPAVVTGIVRAGEAGAAVPAALHAAADLAEATAATRAAIRSALAYPTLLLVAGCLSAAVLVGVVLPRFAAILADIGQRLPATTRLVLDGATVLRRLAVPTLVAVVCGFALFDRWFRREESRLVVHQFLLRIPIVGDLRHATATGRGSTALSALLGTGLSTPAALAYGADAVGDVAVAHRMRAARTAVIGGRSLSSSLEATNAYTPGAIRLIRAGEESGRVPAMLAHAGRLESQRAQDHVKRLVRLLEPALILVFAGFVGLIAAALLQAVYTVRPT